MLDIPFMIGKREYRIQSDRRNFIICSDGGINKKTGKRVWKPEKFYQTPEWLIKSLLEMSLRGSDAKTLLELQNALKQATETLRGIYTTEIDTAEWEEDDELDKD